MRTIAFTSAVMAVLAGIAAAQCPALPLVTIPIDQYVPENNGLDGPRLWQLSVCSPATYSQCGTIPASYVIEINGNGDGCDAGFDTDTSFGVWSDKYGGKNSYFSGSSSPGGNKDRIANVTLICDQSASQPTADGPVVAYSAQSGTVWNFDIRVKTTAACSEVPPPPCPTVTAAPVPSPTAAPTASPVPSPTAAPTAAGIVIEQYAAPGCTDKAATERFTNPQCSTIPGSTGSFLRFCSGGAMNIQRFNASSTCQGMPMSAGGIPVGTCEESPMDGTSFSVTQCN